jgi:cation diffusion facilitator family transporter
MKRTLQSCFIPNYGDSTDPIIRAKYGYLEAIASIVGNTLLFLLKLGLGLFVNSIALIADSIHSLSDVSTSGVVIFGFKAATKKPDKEHPFGHGRAEYIATLIIAILLILVGIGFIQQSLERIVHPHAIEHQEYAIIIGTIVLISAALKELMARYSYAIARIIKSDVLKADAWHHRSDAISSIGVAIGIVGSHYGYPILDPIFGVIVSVIIIYVGIKLLSRSANFLIGSAPDAEVLKQIHTIAQQTMHIKGIHDISLHDYGTTKVLTLHAEIDSNLSLEEAHKIADALEANIRNQMNFSIIIHLDPSERVKDKKDKMNIIENILKKEKEIKSYHKIHVLHVGDEDRITMHLLVDENMPISESHELCHSLKKRFEKSYGPCEVDIHFEPCNSNCRICTMSCSKRSKK